MGDSGWTIMVYLCGTDLESECYAASMDIEEALNGRYSDDVRIVYQTGGTAEWNEYYGISNSVSQRYVTNNGELELVDEFELCNMGDPNTLADFVSWGVENYPAKRMGLVFWNHGGGSISGVCFDEMNDSDSLSLREIDSALNSVYGQMSDKFEFIGFDACLMSTLETANIIAPYARYMFASEETEPGGGWNYTDIVDFLSGYPDATGAHPGGGPQPPRRQAVHRAVRRRGAEITLPSSLKFWRVHSWNPSGRTPCTASGARPPHFGGNRRSRTARRPIPCPKQGSFLPRSAPRNPGTQSQGRCLPR